MSTPDKSRLSRLTQIITQLQSKRMITARELAEAHGVSVRTIYRDIRALEESGIPILTEEGKGYRLMEGYRLPPVMFTEQEAAAMVTAEKMIARNRDQSFVEHYASAVSKVKAVLKYSQKEKVDLLSDRVMFSNYNAATTSNFLMQIQSAICQFKVLEIDYHSLQDQKTSRRVEPFAIYSTQGNWLMIAYCRMRLDFRAFRLDRVETLTELTERFEPHDMTLQEYFESYQKKLNTPDIPLTQSTSSFVSNQNEEVMKTTKIEPFKVIGISKRTTNQGGEASKDIPALWNRFMQENVSAQIPNKVGAEMLALYCNYEGDHNAPYDVILGCKVSSTEEVPAGMVAHTYEGGVCAEYTAKGDLMTTVVDVWHQVWSGLDNRSYTTDFEVYGEKAANPKDGEASIFVSIDS